MSRLIDADALIEEMKKEQESGKYDKNTIIVSDCFIGILNRQPTAYDVSKVAAELCKEANDTTVNFCNGVFVNVDRAIDIVKRGGVE